MRMTRRSFRKPGRLILSRPRGLRARAVRLMPGRVMEWHTTGEREELLLGVAGRVRIDVGTRRRIVLGAGQSLFLPRGTRHRVVNASRAAGVYVYVTGSAEC